MTAQPETASDGGARRATQEWRDQEVRRLRAVQKGHDDVLPDRDVREAARRLGLSPRHVRRLVADPTIGTNRKAGYVADETALRTLAAAGSIKNALKRLTKTGEFTQSAKTLSRGLKRAPTGVAAGATGATTHGSRAGPTS